MEDNKIYFRSTLDSESEGRTIKGVAIVFNSWSRDLGGFKERILPGAVTQDLVNRSDIIANCEHDSRNYMMARSRNGKGTLSLSLEDDGLHFSFEAPTTPKGEELLYHVRNGNIDECSFAFTISPEKDSEKWYKDSEGNFLRDIKRIGGLYDISLVAHAAYGDTYCYTRDLESIKERSKELNDKLDSMMREVEELKIDIQENGKEDGTPGDTD